MATEEEIAGVYEDFLGNRGDMFLVNTLKKLVDADGHLEDYEREHLIQMILNIDWTGKYDSEFEDQRKDLVDGDNYRCPGQ